MNGLSVLLPLALAAGGPVVPAATDVILTYEVPHLEEVSEEGPDVDVLVVCRVFQKRLRAMGIHDAAVRGRVQGEDQAIEVILPGVEPGDLEVARRVLAAQGRLELLLAARSGGDLDVGREHRRLEEHLLTIRASGEPVTRDLDLSALTAGRNTPDQTASLRWAPVSPTHSDHNCEFHDRKGSPDEVRFELLEVPHDNGLHFTQRDLKQIRPQAEHRTGRTAIFFDMTEEAGERFHEFTDRNVQRYLAVVVDGEILSLPIIMSALPGVGMISGGPDGFRDLEAREMVAVLQAGELPGRPVLVSEQSR